MKYTMGVVTVSDSCSQGVNTDLSGPVLIELLKKCFENVDVLYRLVPDDKNDISNVLKELADDYNVALVLTTGGTGFTNRDVTPEATIEVSHRNAPGLAEAMRAASLKITPHAMLSRAVSVIRGECLIINMPGSVKAVKENFAVIAPALPHAIKLMNEGSQDCGR